MTLNNYNFSFSIEKDGQIKTDPVRSIINIEQKKEKKNNERISENNRKRYFVLIENL